MEQQKGSDDQADQLNQVGKDNISTEPPKMPYTKPAVLRLAEEMNKGRGIITCGLGSAG
jgi:hypothetical protein